MYFLATQYVVQVQKDIWLFKINYIDNLLLVNLMILYVVHIN